jgi:hypothetical protein
MTLSRRKSLSYRASVILSLAVAVLCPPAECRTSQQTPDTHINPPRAEDGRAKPPTRPTELEAFAAEVEAAPPEVTSDALIRLASSTRVTDPAWKKELIERAFVLVGTSRRPVRKRAAPYVNSLADNSAAYLSQAYGLGLDALSLRVRAVRAMLPLDAVRAREMFGQIPPRLPLPSLSCKDAMVYDVSDFYALAGEVALKAFGGEEVTQGARARFLLPYAEELSSPAQVMPTLKLVLAAGRRPEDMTLLAPALAKAIRNLSADDRSFTSAVSSDGLADAVNDLRLALGKREDNLAGDIVEAYRKFLRSGMTGERCAENVPRFTPRYLSEANSLLFKTSPLNPEELKPSGVGGRADIRGYWQTPEAKALLSSYKQLRFGDGSVPAKYDTEGVALTREDTGTPEWEAQLRRFLSDLESWSGSGEHSNIDFFNQQQMLYMALLEIKPSGQPRAEVLASWLKSLGDRRDGEAELLRYFYASELLKAVNASPPAARDDFMQRMIYSGDAVLSTMAREMKLKLRV